MTHQAPQVGETVMTIYGLEVVVQTVGEDFAGTNIECVWVQNGAFNSRWLRPGEISAVIRPPPVRA